MKYVKSLDVLLKDAADSEKGLKRTLGAWNLVALGIGAIIGAGLFVRTAAASAEHAGPAVTLSFIVAAIGCAFAGLCYAEFASMIPIAGSAYTYSYATMDLVLEYALGAATVSIAWSEYLNNLLGGAIPYEWCHSPFETSAAGVTGIMNVPALFILLVLTLVLIRGMNESATLNAVIVFVKVAIVLVFIALGWNYINPVNHTPYIIPAGTPGHESFFRHGYGGILAGAGVVFFAFIGFDAVSTAAQEAKNPKRDMPIGILVSLAVCTVLYILFAHVLTGIANYTEFNTVGKEASVAYAIQHHMTAYTWLAPLISIAIIAGFSSVILVMLMGQSRVFYSMSKDGLVPPVFSKLHPKYKTPYKSNWLFLAFVGGFAAFIPGHVAGDMTSIGTLFAFVLVCAGIMVMRKSNPDLPRPFRTPLVPLIPILGIITCGMMIFGLGIENWLRLIVWLLIGFVIYYTYSVKHSHVRKGITEAAQDPPSPKYTE
jgi:APA family basic amino acid/polyamine antiporter